MRTQVRNEARRKAEYHDYLAKCKRDGVKPGETPRKPKHASSGKSKKKK